MFGRVEVEEQMTGDERFSLLVSSSAAAPDPGSSAVGELVLGTGSLRDASAARARRFQASWGR